jgi:hypothetical protein
MVKALAIRMVAAMGIGGLGLALGLSILVGLMGGTVEVPSGISWI